MDRFQDKQTFHRDAGAVGAASDGMAPGQVYTAVVQSKEVSGVAPVTIPALHLSYTFQARVNVGVTVGATVLVIFDENKIPWILGGGPPFVTALPANPIPGQEVYFIADATNGVSWHLRYEAGAFTYKWWYLGGPAIESQENEQRGPFTVGAAQKGTWVSHSGPKIVLPLQGIYDIGSESGIWFSSGGNTYQGVAGVLADPHGIGAVKVWQHLHAEQRIAITPAQTLEQQYNMEAEGELYVDASRLWARPVRVI